MHAIVSYISVGVNLLSMAAMVSGMLMHCGRGGGQRGFADTGLPLQKQRASQAQGQKQGNGEALVRHVVVVRQPLPQVRK